MGFHFFSSPTKLVTNAPPFLASLHPIDPQIFFWRVRIFLLFICIQSKTPLPPSSHLKLLYLKKQNFVDDVDENSESPRCLYFFLHMIVILC